LVPSVAVTVALRLLAILAPAVAVKVVVVAPAATVTDAGTVSEALLLASVRFEPPVGAAAFKVAVQLATALALRLAGLHARDEMVGTVTIAFVVAVTASALPRGSTPTGLLIVIAVVPAVGVSVSVTVAATPEAIVLAFAGPASRQVTEPLAGAQ
jgi:hypothetical protein